MTYYQGHVSDFRTMFSTLEYKFSKDKFAEKQKFQSLISELTVAFIEFIFLLLLFVRAPLKNYIYLK